MRLPANHPLLLITKNALPLPLSKEYDVPKMSNFTCELQPLPSIPRLLMRHCARARPIPSTAWGHVQRQISGFRQEKHAVGLGACKSRLMMCLLGRGHAAVQLNARVQKPVHRLKLIPHPAMLQHLVHHMQVLREQLGCSGPTTLSSSHQGQVA